MWDLMRALDAGQRFEHTCWILLLWWRWLQTSKILGLALHVGPNKSEVSLPIIFFISHAVKGYTYKE